MWIKRHLSCIFDFASLLETVLIQGPRQVGKSSFLEHYAPKGPRMIELDDLALRTVAESDPALFFSQYPSPVIIDEFQYAPNLLPEIKRLIDTKRRAARNDPHPRKLEAPDFFLCGSNQIEIDRAIKETLAGRVSIFTLHGLSVSEIFEAFPQLSPWEYFWRGGFPELYVRDGHSPLSYINDYITTFIEKDIARSGGITKVSEFLLVVKLLAARVGNILNRDSIANDAGIASKTVGEWIDVLERTHIAYLLKPYSNNLNSRLTKSPKVFLIDTGLATRLQGYVSQDTILSSPHAGALFENLVVAEVIKARDHYQLPIELSFWRTREGEEVDLVLKWGANVLLIEVKLAIQGAVSYSLPPSASKEFGEKAECLVVTLGGRRETLPGGALRLPITSLTSYIVNRVGWGNRT